MAKASPDESDRPGWPAKSPDGKGGQFRPKDSGEAEATSRAERLRRLAARKSLQAVLRQVLTAKRLARLAVEVRAEADVPATVTLVEDMSELLEEAVAETEDVEAAASSSGDRGRWRRRVSARGKHLGDLFHVNKMTNKAWTLSGRHRLDRREKPCGSRRSSSAARSP